MHDKLQKRIEEAEDEIAGEIVDARSDAHREAAKMRAMFVLGGVTVAKKVAASLNAEAIKILSRFQEDKMHEDLGFGTFVEFLNESEYSPLTKTQFYDGKGLLEKEGDAMFDMLTELGISIRKRKLLGSGNVELSGETLIVHNGDDTTEISIHDRSSILDAITALADANAEKSIKLERQKEQLDKADGKIRDAHAETDRIRAARISEFAADAHMTARVELGLAFGKFTDIVANLSPVEKDQFRDSVLEDLAGWSSSLRSAYQTGGIPHSAIRNPHLHGDSLEESLDNFLGLVDLDADQDNDGDLAAKL